MKKVLNIMFIVFLSLIVYSCSNSARSFDISKVSTMKSIKDYSGRYSLNQMDVVRFGSYPQSDIDGNNTEPIEWIVLDKQENKALLLSKKIIDYEAYGDSVRNYIDGKRNLWKNSDIREWLNNDFFYKAFRANEQLMVLNTLLVNNNEKSGILNEESTEDKVFLLSADEAKQYFAPLQTEYRVYNGDNDVECLYSDKLKAEYTNYVTNRFESNDKSCDWWLRTPEFYNNFSGDTLLGASYIDYDGIIEQDGYNVDAVLNVKGVRPALWVKY